MGVEFDFNSHLIIELVCDKMNYNYLNLIKLYQDNLRANNSNLGFYVALDGFSKGNMDSTLYNQFENKVPRKLDEKNPLHMLMAYTGEACLMESCMCSGC